jgi:uncharacterized protein (TIGR02597 family)
MRNQITHCLTGIALAASMLSVVAQTSVATVPQGMISYPLRHGESNLLSLPLTNTERYTSQISAVTAGTISVADAPAPFTTSLAVSGSPYFVKFLSGNESGRVVLITSNTTSALTLDTTDHSTGSAVPLNMAGFNVQAGDKFEIFPGDTLASILGLNTAESPLVLTGARNSVMADTVTLFTSVNAPIATYFFNTTAGCWQQIGVNGNANTTIIYPYSAFAIDRRQAYSDTTLVITGRVTPVAIPTKLQGQGTVFTSTHYATDVTLSQLQFGSNWTTGTTPLTADTLSVWNSTSNSFDVYYQKPDLTWRKTSDATTDQSSFSIAAGTVTAIAKRTAVTGSATFLQTPLPYSLD